MENIQIFKELWPVHQKLLIESRLRESLSSEEFESIVFGIRGNIVNNCQSFSTKEFTSIELAWITKMVTEFLKSNK